MKNEIAASARKPVLLRIVWATLQVFRLIAPLSSLYAVWRVLAYVLRYRRSFHPLFSTRSTVTKRIFLSFLTLEAAFWLGCELYRASRQSINQKPLTLELQERDVLYRRCLSTVLDPKKYVTEWFMNHPLESLKRGNIEEWLAFGLFHEMNVVRMASDERRQLGRFVELLEERLGAGFRFPEGYDPEASMMKYTFDPVTASHRPITLYFLVHFLLQNVITPIYLRVRGFQYGTSGSLVYWFYPGKGEAAKQPPLLFMHGIGVGLAPYARFVSQLVDQVRGTSGNLDIKDRALILVEVHAVSQRFAPPDIHRDVFVQEMRDLVAKTGYESAHFIGHSFGTFCLAWLVMKAPELVHRAVFLDPVCFCLHYPQLVHNILYKRGDTGDVREEVLHYLVRAELFFNIIMRRSFFWYCNILFFEQLRCPAMVICSDEDDIVPVAAVSEYISKYNQGKSPCAEVNDETGPGHVSFLMLHNAEHGAFVFNAAHGKYVTESVSSFLKL